MTTPTASRPRPSAEGRRLASLTTDQLTARAAARRDELFGSLVTYSPKVFVPLTRLCRDRCGYCTFATTPAHLEQPFMTIDEILAVARRGATAGCHEALFTLGEAPEERHPAARAWLDEHGWPSTTAYLAAAAEAVLADTGLLPHANAGAISRDELALLRPVSPSQGMMVETLRDDLAAHRGAPDKHPARRLATLEAAGELAIPFTTGILVGIGEDEHDRVAALEAIAAAHARHGHVQEVIVQNFLPKPGTGMRDHPPCPREDHVRAVALARLLLPADVHVQAPPNLADEVDLADLLAAGVDDWGGVSPVTADHVNPERPWPALARLRRVTEDAGHALAPRLTAHPRFVRDPVRWFDDRVRFPVMDRADADGLGRDDPGATWPEQHAAAANVGTGAEVVQVGRRSTAWYSGSTTTPPTLLPGRSAAHGEVREVLDGVLAGQDPGRDQLLALLGARGPEVVAVAEVADELRRRIVGEDITWVANRNINYTNVCTFRCTFCGFSKGPASLNLRGTPYLLTLEDIADRVREAWEAGATEVCLQGGVHPDFDGEYYVDVAAAVHDAVPDIHIHGFTALEVAEGARRLGEPLADYLRRLRAAGLRSLPGTAAEILDDEVRAVLCPDKITTDEWLEVHRTAHAVGLRSNITMMFGSVERPRHWVTHLLRTRALQRETGGFTEFVGLPFVHMAAPIYLKRAARRGPTWREVLLVHAVARIAYGDDVPNVQASWVKLGVEGAVQLLAAGVNDLGGTLMDENISRAAGATHGQGLTAEDFARVGAAAGRPTRQRSTLYGAPPPGPHAIAS